MAPCKAEESHPYKLQICLFQGESSYLISKIYSYYNTFQVCHPNKKASNVPPPLQSKKAKETPPGLLIDEMNFQPSLPQLAPTVPHVPEGVLIDEFDSQISPLTVQLPVPNIFQPQGITRSLVGIDLTPPHGDTFFGMAVHLKDGFIDSQECEKSSKDNKRGIQDANLSSSSESHQ